MYEVITQFSKAGIPDTKSFKYKKLFMALDTANRLADYQNTLGAETCARTGILLGRVEVWRNGSQLLSLEPEMHNDSGTAVNSGKLKWHAQGEDSIELELNRNLIFQSTQKALLEDVHIIETMRRLALAEEREKEVNSEEVVTGHTTSFPLGGRRLFE